MRSTTPYLVYSVNHRLNATDAALIDTTLTLENITDDKAYDHVQIRIIADDPDIILNATVRPYQPAWEGDVAPSFSARSATYNLPKIQPNDKFDLYITHKYKDLTHIVLIAHSSNTLLTRFTTVFSCESFDYYANSRSNTDRHNDLVSASQAGRSAAHD